MKENQIYRKFWNLSLGSWSVASHMTNDGGCSDVVLRHSGACETVAWCWQSVLRLQVLLMPNR